jgi:hypothetical protein
MTSDLNDRGGATSTVAVDYHWTCTVSGEGLEAVTAEQWLRRVWEDAPTGLRVFLRLGWRFGLGLRLGPADPSHVLGWLIDSSTATTVVVSATSRILDATNTVTTDGDVIRWQTDVRYANGIGRLLWPPAALVHQRMVPWSVRRTIRSQALGPGSRLR